MLSDVKCTDYVDFGCDQIWSTAQGIRACFQHFFVICHETWGTPLSLVAPLLPSLPENVYETLPAVARRQMPWLGPLPHLATSCHGRRCPCQGHYAAGWSAWLVRRCHQHPEALLDPAWSCLILLEMVKHQMKHSMYQQVVSAIFPLPWVQHSREFSGRLFHLRFEDCSWEQGHKFCRQFPADQPTLGRKEVQAWTTTGIAFQSGER